MLGFNSYLSIFWNFVLAMMGQKTRISASKIHVPHINKRGLILTFNHAFSHVICIKTCITYWKPLALISWAVTLAYRHGHGICFRTDYGNQDNYNMYHSLYLWILKVFKFQFHAHGAWISKLGPYLEYLFHMISYKYSICIWVLCRNQVQEKDVAIGFD